MTAFFQKEKSTVISDKHISPNVTAHFESNGSERISTGPTLPKLSSLESTSPSSREQSILFPRNLSSSDHFDCTPAYVKRNRHQLAADASNKKKKTTPTILRGIFNEKKNCLEESDSKSSNKNQEMREKDQHQHVYAYSHLMSASMISWQSKVWSLCCFSNW